MEWKGFLLIYKFIMWWHFYSTVCAVDSSDYIRKTVSRFKLRFNVGLFNCIVGIWYTCWDADNSVPLGWHGLAQGRLAKSQSVGQLPLECTYCLNPSVRVTCGTSRALLLLCCAPAPAAALPTVPGGLPWKRLMSQLSSCASKSCQSLNTCFLPIAQFTMSLKQPLFLIVCIATLCACFISTHVIADTCVNCSCVSNVHITHSEDKLCSHLFIITVPQHHL